MKSLSFIETRVIGCLIEKSFTTPEQYPLSMNALTNACNQKSNRDPVSNFDEAQVQDTVKSLAEAGLVTELSGFGSRVVKVKHRFCNTEFSELRLSKQELGIVCVLFLRGPQTPGELRTRTARLCEFQSLEQVEGVLNELCSKEKVIKLEREPGKREARFAHLFSDEVFDSPSHHAVAPNTAPVTDDSLVSRVEVEALKRQIAELTEALGG